MEVIITKSNKKGKKYDAIIDGRKTISFGAAGMSDFTMHKDTRRKESYLKRHRKNEDWGDPRTAGFYATNLLWNKPSLSSSVADINAKFQKQVHVKLKL
jgi:hypothetical protein